MLVEEGSFRGKTAREVLGSLQPPLLQLRVELEKSNAIKNNNKPLLSWHRSKAENMHLSGSRITKQIIRELRGRNIFQLVGRDLRRPVKCA